MDERKRDSMIAYLRHRMEDFGITPDDLAATLAPEPVAGRYRSAHGDSWSGEGAMPQWLKQAISAGQSIGHFELSSGVVSGSSLQARGYRCRLEKRSVRGQSARADELPLDPLQSGSIAAQKIHAVGRSVSVRTDIGSSKMNAHSVSRPFDLFESDR